jgi:hypothetical protein
VIHQVSKNKYTVEAETSYGKIDVRKLLEFKCVHILKDLNQDIIENICIYDIDNNFASLFIEYKHFLKDFGFPKFGANLILEKIENDKSITFACSNNNTQHVSSRCEILPINKLFFNFNIESYSKIKIVVNFEFDIKFEIPQFVEKFVFHILHKMFMRLKEFIEMT